MRVVVRGWNRDCGETVIMHTDELDDMPVAPGNVRFLPGETCLQVRVGSFSRSTRADVWASAKLNLNGLYQTHLEIGGLEIARLFYLTHGHRKLEDIGRLLDEFKDAEQRRAAAVTVPKEDAHKAIVAQWLLLPAAERANEGQACEFAMQAMERYSWRATAGAYHEAVDWLRPHVGKP
jgi:hypothetical protein